MAITGDYIGFSFNGISSTELGIFRTQKGLSKDNLLPNFTDNTSTVDGVDETYYFYTQIQKREFTVDFAFEGLTESQIRKLRTTFRPNLIGELVFDELPFKYYQAKISAPPSIAYVPFGEGNNDEGGRYYNGNGSIKFVCYYPYAKSKFKTLPTSTACPNVNEWAKSSGILTSEVYATGQFDINQSGIIYLYNPGDIETDFELTFKKSTTTYTSAYIGLIMSAGQTPCKKIIINGNDLISGRNYKLSSRTNLITDLTQNSAYNQCITGGDFFKIPITTSTQTRPYIYSYGLEPVNNNAWIKYDYLYY